MNAFSDIIGNEQVKRSLKNTVLSQKPSHAYIFYGAYGIGKRTVAKMFAKALECDQKKDDCCNECVSCRSFDSGNHPDVIFVRLSGKKSLGVEEVREQIVQKVASKQYQYRYKIFIVEDADLMTVAAQNALLKTLEEPPSFAIFLLLAENKEKFLPTILSRAVLVPIRPLSEEIVAKYLSTHLTLPTKQAALFGSISQGSIGQAMEMAQSEDFIIMRKNVIGKLIKLQKLDIASGIAMAKELEIYKDSKQLLDMIYLWYRDLLSARLMGDASMILQKDQTEALLDIAKETSEKTVLNQIDAVWQAQKQLRQNASFQSVLEVLFIKLKES